MCSWYVISCCCVPVLKSLMMARWVKAADEPGCCEKQSATAAAQTCCIYCKHVILD